MAPLSLKVPLLIYRWTTVTNKSIVDSYMAPLLIIVPEYHLERLVSQINRNQLGRLVSLVGKNVLKRLVSQNGLT